MNAVQGAVLVARTLDSSDKSIPLKAEEQRLRLQVPHRRQHLGSLPTVLKSLSLVIERLGTQDADLGSHLSTKAKAKD